MRNLIVLTLIALCAFGSSEPVQASNRCEQFSRLSGLLKEGVGKRYGDAWETSIQNELKALGYSPKDAAAYSKSLRRNVDKQMQRDLATTLKPRTHISGAELQKGVAFPPYDQKTVFKIQTRDNYLPSWPKEIKFDERYFRQSGKELASKERDRLLAVAMQNGVTSNAGQNGLKVIRNSIYEIKDLKSNVRIYGCMVGKTMVLVTHSLTDKEKDGAIARAISLCKGLGK